MASPDGRQDVPASEGVATAARSTETRSLEEPGGGVDAYPYDPTLRLEAQVGLDRLRCIEDRRIAAELYDLYIYAERNRSCRPRTREPNPSHDFERIRVMAARALAGEFGCEARELAEYLLLDEAGRERIDGPSLREFAKAFKRLRRG